MSLKITGNDNIILSIYFILITFFFFLVFSAKDLASMDSNGFSDPYFYVIFNKLKHKSEIIRKTLNPTWNQSFN